MTQAPRIRIRIDRLRVRGGTQGDAATLAEGLRNALAAGLAANPALSGQGANRLRVTLPPSAGQGPAAQGREAGRRIAGALGAPKGSR